MADLTVSETAALVPSQDAAPPLAGYTIGITAARRADELAALLQRRGATVLRAPALRIVPLADDTERLLARGVVEALVHGQQAAGRALAAEAIDFAHPETAAHCQILFVGRSETASRTLLAEASQRPVLTVTDRSAGTRGGIIEFVPTAGSVRFSIHRQAAEARQLVLSSKLLAVAASVEP